MNEINSQILKVIKEEVLLCLKEDDFLISIIRKTGEENQYNVKNYRRGWTIDECNVILKEANKSLETPQHTEEFTGQGKQRVFTIPMEVKPE